ncbi:MAG: phosphoribosylamine--glycine ligase [Bdellovibrio sp.]
MKKLNVLVLGSGGREHALCESVLKSDLLKRLFVMPGNAGMKRNPKINVINGKVTDFDAIDSVIQVNQIDLVIVGPEDPLAMGIADHLSAKNISVYGPKKFAAQLESSKAFSKEFMKKYEIPTAQYRTVYNLDQAKSIISGWKPASPIVVKASALAQGKGVVVAQSKDEAVEACRLFFDDPECSVKTDSIVLEEFLEGEELSAFAICDGQRYFYLGHACDYKRVKDGDLGPNTGGMGGYTPKQWPNNKVILKIHEIVQKVINGMKSEGHEFLGTLFVGSMIKGDDVKVVEFNVRLGDPETQMLLPRVQGDLLEAFYFAACGKLNELSRPLTLSDSSAVHIVLTSGGYPTIDQTPMSLHHPIHIDAIFTSADDVFLFFAGVGENEEGQLINTGGRVLGVTALGSDLELARTKAYQAVSAIHFKDSHYRKDIAAYERGHTR